MILHERGSAGRPVIGNSRHYGFVGLLVVVFAFVPVLFTSAESWRFTPTSGANFKLADGHFFNHASFGVRELPPKPGIPNPPGLHYFLRLGNFATVARNAQGQDTNVGIGRIGNDKFLHLTVTIPKQIVRELESHGVTKPVLYFWSPQPPAHWVSAQAPENPGPYKIDKFTSSNWGNAKRFTVQLSSWPANDPACGVGG